MFGLFGVFILVQGIVLAQYMNGHGPISATLGATCGASFGYRSVQFKDVASFPKFPSRQPPYPKQNLNCRYCLLKETRS